MTMTKNLTATMTATNATVLVTITDPTGDTVQTFSTKENGKFLARLDKMMTGAGFARSGYAATGGVLVATVRDYRPAA